MITNNLHSWRLKRLESEIAHCQKESPTHVQLTSHGHHPSKAQQHQAGRVTQHASVFFWPKIVLDWAPTFLIFWEKSCWPANPRCWMRCAAAFQGKGLGQLTSLAKNVQICGQISLIFDLWLLLNILDVGSPNNTYPQYSTIVYAKLWSLHGMQNEIGERRSRIAYVGACISFRWLLGLASFGSRRILGAFRSQHKPFAQSGGPDEHAIGRCQLGGKVG